MAVEGGISGGGECIEVSQNGLARITEGTSASIVALATAGLESCVVVAGWTSKNCVFLAHVEPFGTDLLTVRALLGDTARLFVVGTPNALDEDLPTKNMLLQHLFGPHHTSPVPEVHLGAYKAVSINRSGELVPFASRDDLLTANPVMMGYQTKVHRRHWTSVLNAYFDWPRALDCQYDGTAFTNTPLLHREVGLFKRQCQPHYSSDVLTKQNKIDIIDIISRKQSRFFSKFRSKLDRLPPEGILACICDLVATMNAWDQAADPALKEAQK